MIERHELTSLLVVEPGSKPRVRVHAGPGWVAGEHGQDLEAQARVLCDQHGGTWREVDRVPGAHQAKCTKARCKWTTRVPAGRPLPEACERCGSGVEAKPLDEAGVVITYEQGKPPTESFHAEQAFRAAPQRTLTAAACAWARALGKERKRDVSTLCALLVENKRATRAELASLVSTHLAPQRAKATRARGAQRV